MRIALVIDTYDKEKLEQVKAEMKQLGTPTIHAVWMECYGHWAALDGCHRLRAAHELGIVPEIEEVEYSNEMCSTVPGYDGDEDYTIEDISDNSHGAIVLDFED